VWRGGAPWAGRFGLVIAAAGAGKTTALRPLVAAWHEQGRDVYGISLAWRQADDMTGAGTPARNVKALSVFFNAVGEDAITPSKRSDVTVDEWGRVDTLRARPRAAADADLHDAPAAKCRSGFWWSDATLGRRGTRSAADDEGGRR
jgi:hypothetical protein